MSFKSYVKINGEKYRRGFTTGSAAAAAAKAAVSMLFGKKDITEISIITPSGIELTISIKDIEVNDGFVRVTVEKDGGDDPDVTDGLDICARVEKIESGIELSGGKGVGRVTRLGLSVPVDKAAINPVPEQMIREAAAAVLPENSGVKITIEVPHGEEIAEKTFNPNLGIVGGISILGTTGIVEPMSEKAYKESLALEIKQAAAEGQKELVLVFGNYGKDKARELGYESGSVVRMSNFVGYMLNVCQKTRVRQITILGHTGKLVKVAGGIFNTHSKVADARLEILAAYTAAAGGSSKIVSSILASNTTEEAVKIILEVGLEEIFDVLAEKVVSRVQRYLGNISAGEELDNKADDSLKVKSIIFSMEEGVLGRYG